MYLHVWMATGLKGFILHALTLNELTIYWQLV